MNTAIQTSARLIQIKNTVTIVDENNEVNNKGVSKKEKCINSVYSIPPCSPLFYIFSLLLFAFQTQVDPSHFSRCTGVFQFPSLPSASLPSPSNLVFLQSSSASSCVAFHIYIIFSVYLCYIFFTFDAIFIFPA